MNARVYFVGPNWPDLKRWTFPWLCARLAVTLTRSNLLHVAVGDAEHVGSCCVRHTGVYKRATYEAKHPSLIGWFVIRIETPIHPIRVGYAPPITSIWPSLLAFVTGGRFRCHNCVTAVCDVLREGGVAVPPRVYSPKQLHRFLEKEGYRWVSKH